MAETKKAWFVLRAISGKEAKVKEVIDAAIKNTDLGQHVLQVLIPTEKVYRVRNGKKVLKELNLYSGYVFVECSLTKVVKREKDESAKYGDNPYREVVSWKLSGDVIHELRNTTNVIDFLRGRSKTSEPEMLRESEVMRMLGAADDLRQPGDAGVADFIVGQPVKVTFGPFSGFSGVVKEVNADRKKIKVEVKIFGRGTDLELENTQVEKQ